MEIRTNLTPDSLTIKDKYGVGIVFHKYIQIGKNGEHTERLEIFPENAGELDDSDNYTINVPVSEFDAVIDVIKMRFGAKESIK